MNKQQILQPRRYIWAKSRECGDILPQIGSGLLKTHLYKAMCLPW